MSEESSCGLPLVKSGMLLAECDFKIKKERVAHWRAIFFITISCLIIIKELQPIGCSVYAATEMSRPWEVTNGAHLDPIVET